jgi:hypothetical protein
MQPQTGMATNAVGTTGAESLRIVEAAGYLEQCRREGRLFAVLTGSSAGDVALVLQRFVADLPSGARVARTPAPTDSSHAFLESILAQFGFDPFDATADDLLRLLTVVLRQGGTRAGGSAIVIEDAHCFGPRVLETIRDLGQSAQDWRPAPLFVLTGRPALNRVLDSVGMAGIAQQTRLRFDLDSQGCVAAPVVHETAATPSGRARLVSLLLWRDHKEIGRVGLSRDRVLIGRSEQSDVRLNSRYVSREHALLLRNADGDWLIDLKSTNGTIVNSELIDRRRLAPGDVISVGNFRLRYGSDTLEPELLSVAGTPEEPGEQTAVMRSPQALRTVTPEDDASPRASTGDASSAA